MGSHDLVCTIIRSWPNWGEVNSRVSEFGSELFLSCENRLLDDYPAGRGEFNRSVAHASDK